MDVLSAIKTRRSIRQFSSKPVEEEKLRNVLEAARLAPSASNRQNWKFIAVRDDAARAKLAEAALGQLFLGKAPVILVSCATEPTGVMRCGQSRHTVDLSIATTFMILEAHEQGLGTCWLGHFDENAVKEALGIPEDMRVVTMIPLGYPAENPVQKPRKRFEEVVCYEKYY